MSEEEMKSWQYMNSKLQHEYQQYNQSNGKEKDEVASRLQEILEWSKFADFIYRKHPSASLSGFARYGMDYDTERAIQEINKIAIGEIEY